MVPMGKRLACQSSLWENDGCGFSVPLGFSADQLKAAAEKRVPELKEVRR